MLSQLRVHRHDNWFARLSLLIDDSILINIDVVPFHLNAVAQSRSCEIAQKDERLPVD